MSGIKTLKHNELLLANVSGVAHRVTEGAAIVFVLPLQEGKGGRRMFLAEVREGDCVPSLNYFGRGAPDSEPCDWTLAIVPIEDGCTLEETPDTAELREAFADRLELPGKGLESFDGRVVELYRLNLVKDLRNIYAAELTREEAYRKSLGVIGRLFRKDDLRRSSHEHTGDALYDAAAFLCDWCWIPIAPLNAITANCGHSYNVKDIARLSGFVCREVMLDESWFRKDISPIMAFRQNGSPVVCIPKGRSKYVVYDPKTAEVTPLTEQLAGTLKPKAMMFYRPFPAKKMDMKSVFKFALRDINSHDIARVLLLTLLGTLIGLLLPILNEQIYDVFIPMGNARGLMELCFVVFACSLGNIGFTVVKNLSNFRALSRMKYSVQAAVTDRLFNLPESFFRGRESADLGDRALGIAQAFSTMASTIAGVGLTAVFSVVYLVRMFGYSSKLSWVSLLMLLPAMALVLLFGVMQMRHERKRLELGGRISSVMFQMIGGVSKLRRAGAEDRALYQYMRLYSDACAIDMKRERFALWGAIVSGAVSTVFSAVLYYSAVNSGGSFSMGEFIGFTTAFGSFSAAMMQVVGAFVQLSAMGPALERMKPILETPPEKEEDAAMPGVITGDIELNNVTFSYDPEETAPVLKDVSLHVRPGEYVGIVGPSGCGKSTLLKLLLGFEKPQSGRVYYDGKDIETMDKRELRKRFGVVLQNGGLISGSIYDNITITTPHATMADVKEAVRDAGLEADIAQMPMGLHTLLSEGDGSISGGQRQRVLIARAIVGKPKLLFFDEATSALDNATQAAVCESLDALNSTRVVIAHRLSTIMNCDRILVMEDGEIVEQGSYDELMKAEGRFYELAKRQIS